MPESWDTCKLCGYDPAVPVVVDSAPVPEGLAAMATEIEATAAAAAKRKPQREKGTSSSTNVLMYAAAITCMIVMIVVAGLVRDQRNETVDATPATMATQPAERAVPAEPPSSTVTTAPNPETATRRVFVAAGLNALCAGTFDKVDTVAPYEGGPGDHPLTIVDLRGGATFEVDADQPRYPSLAPTVATAGNRIENTEIVLCLTDGDQRTETAMCAGAEVDLTTNDLDLRLVAAYSGDELWTSTVEAPTPIECPEGINPFGPTDVPMPVPVRAIGDKINELVGQS